MKAITPALLSLALPLLGSALAGADLPAEGRDFFERKIRPVLVAECYDCHGAQKQKAGLRLDSRPGWQKGGDAGVVIVPGDPAKSSLLAAINHTDPDLKMPDKAPKLAAAVIADFERWIAMGAPDPRDDATAEPAGKPNWSELFAARKGWWSLQPVKDHVPPAVADRAWSAHPVDRFLLAKMETKGLAPAPDTDPRALLRRLAFILTGLPPTPVELDRFATDFARDRAAALAAQADLLLASPRFGEHWARHWMDLVRYAETHGSEGDPAIPEAYRYRDYLIRAFNADVPLDQLIREHVAGDLLDRPRLNVDGFNESILGTAHFRFVEHGFQPVDTLDDQVKAVDSQIDVVSKAFQGLTISCARCHDHKFDAVSQRDYTALYGIFSSVRPAQVTIDTAEVLEKNRSELDRLHAQIKAGLAEAWLVAAEMIASRLREQAARAPGLLAGAERIRAVQQELADLDRAAHDAVQAAPARQNLPAAGVAPVAAWDFERGANDVVGKLHGVLEGGAEIRNGRLVLDGRKAYLRTPPLPFALSAKTLEVWVAPANLEQRGGGVMAVENTGGERFDAIALAEDNSKRWTAGSENSERTAPLLGKPETATGEAFVHLAIVYAADNTIAVYRNGESYGTVSSKGDLLEHAARRSRVLLGQRNREASGGFFAGEIEEARLYDRALTADEVAASYRVGTPSAVGQERLLAALTSAQRARWSALERELNDLRTGQSEAGGDRIFVDAIKEAADDPANPLHLWAKLGTLDDARFAGAWHALATSLREKQADALRFNRENFRPLWDLASDDYQRWFHAGTGLGARPARPGEFAVAIVGDRVIEGLAPAGAFTPRLSTKHHGLLTSPRFTIDSESISVRALGGGGAMVRTIVDHYPLPSNPIFPKSTLNQEKPGWVRLETAYRKGSSAYLEFGTRNDLTRPIDDRTKKPEHAPAEGRSFFGVDAIVAHEGKNTPRAELTALLPLLDGAAPATAGELAMHYQRVLAAAVNAWRADTLTEPQRALLDFFARQNFLPTALAALPDLHPKVAEYRRLEAEIPVPRRAPGLLETAGYDAPIFARGDHLKPGEIVPRGYLQVIDPEPYRTALSGRLELAHAIGSAKNPLTARVMANRAWQWVFGVGLVATVDNLGRLGEAPTHPELLDFLAARVVERGWSLKDLLRFLVTTRAFQMSSAPSVRAGEVDPANAWLSHLRVRRLEAESIRDSLLAVAGELQETRYGPSVGPNAPRRSVYLQIRRTRLDPFLQTFDAPAPFSTLGRRDATNVPAQSLLLLNSQFVTDRAATWAKALVGDRSASAEARVGGVFRAALGRAPRADELAAAAAYLGELAGEHRVAPEASMASVRVWQDFTHAIFNLKEFIYVR